MLCLTRKAGEEIHIGHDITIVVVRVSRDRVRLGIQAPANVHIVRGELTVFEQANVSSDSHVAEMACDVA